MATTLCGIRHHGPGSARALLQMLETSRPDVVLVEGPPEGQGLVPALSHPDLELPVALMLHDPEDPDTAAFYPLVEYSPELVAVRWAHQHAVPVELFDAPYSVTARMTRERPAGADDPLALVASLMGYADAEVWWEDTFETAGHDPVEAFSVLEEVMGALREDTEPDGTGERDQLREAHMRLRIRAAEKGHEDVLVVVGAWHLPALGHRPLGEDRALVRALTTTRAKLVPSLVPWSDQRLSRASGYGAGVTSPGWYAHLWRAQEDPVERWLTHSAGVLRANGFTTSTASVIEAVGMATALATLRDRHSPNLEDLLEATEAVMCEGLGAPLELVHEQLVVGTRIGSVPDDAPQGPLALDLALSQKRLRLRPSTRDAVTLDLRETTGLARSELLHRLNVLDVPWGTLEDARGRGTFKEVWSLRWEPEHALALAVQAHLGSTIEAAASARLVQECADADLVRASALVEASLLANLPLALAASLHALDQAAASSPDVEALLLTLGPLGSTLRYGSVRDHSRLPQVFSATLVRASTMVPAQARGLDDDAAVGLLRALEDAHAAVALNASPADAALWHQALEDVSGDGAPRLAGWCTRTLLDLGLVNDAQVRVLVDRYLTTVPPGDGVLWLEGLLGGSAALLLRDTRLWSVLDAWVSELGAEDFSDNLPLLRRTFSGYSGPERRMIGERVAGVTATRGRDLDLTRALGALPATLRIIHA